MYMFFAKLRHQIRIINGAHSSSMIHVGANCWLVVIDNCYTLKTYLETQVLSVSETTRLIPVVVSIE